MACSRGDYRPNFAGTERADEAWARRVDAANISMGRPALSVPSNQEENEHFPTVRVGNFSKGLPHDRFGIVNSKDYDAFVKALVCFDWKLDVPTGEPQEKFRKWTGALAGHGYSLDGPDPADLAMAPAPRIGFSELTAEMAELYAMALVRDLPFSDLSDASAGIGLDYPAGHPEKPGKPATVGDLVEELNKLRWFDSSRRPLSSYTKPGGNPKDLNAHEHRRRKSHWARGENGRLAAKTLFRGSTPGAKSGPYVSQFLLVGTSDKAPGCSGRGADDGVIACGAQTIEQRIRPHRHGVDHMTGWQRWLDVQNGVEIDSAENRWEDWSRFVTTPRDLATWVHYDQLEQAYRNACLIMLENGVPFDRGLADSNHPRKRHRTRGATARPQVLSLLGDCAARALKAVQRQKFQIHRRARPEALAAMLTLEASGHGERLGEARNAIRSVLCELGADDANDPARPGVLLHWIVAHNARQQTRQNAHGPAEANGDAGDLPVIADEANYLLPMAYPEGSPMDPSYGSGHAAIAGACVTILKAYFDLFEADGRTPVPFAETLAPAVYRPEAGNAAALAPAESGEPLTIEGELDKLAANMSLGRSIAGVNYFTDYYDSLRLGERIAVGILEEQMLNHQEPVAMTFNSFDGDRITVATDGGQKPESVIVAVENHLSDDRDTWWIRHIDDFDDPTLDQQVIIVNGFASVSNWTDNVLHA